MHPTLTAPTAAPDLTGRTARCGCGKTAPSSDKNNLAFFEFCGEGSREALVRCKHCSYFESAHAPAVMARNQSLKCTNFEPNGPLEFDRYYCGCRGFD